MVLEDSFRAKHEKPGILLHSKKWYSVTELSSVMIRGVDN